MSAAGHMYIHTYTHTHIHTYTHTHIHTYTHTSGAMATLILSLMGWLRSVGSIIYKSLLQNIVSFIGLFCKRDL